MTIFIRTVHLNSVNGPQFLPVLVPLLDELLDVEGPVFLLQIVVHVSHEFAPRMVQADLGVHSVGRLGLSYGSLDLKIATNLKKTFSAKLRRNAYV